MPFDPSRWMTQRRREIRVGPEFQAVIPDISGTRRVPPTLLQHHLPSSSRHFRQRNNLSDYDRDVVAFSCCDVDRTIPDEESQKNHVYCNVDHRKDDSIYTGRTDSLHVDGADDEQQQGYDFFSADNRNKNPGIQELDPEGAVNDDCDLLISNNSSRKTSESRIYESDVEKSVGNQERYGNRSSTKDYGKQLVDKEIFCDNVDEDGHEGKDFVFDEDYSRNPDKEKTVVGEEAVFFEGLNDEGENEYLDILDGGVEPDNTSEKRKMMTKSERNITGNNKDSLEGFHLSFDSTIFNLKIVNDTGENAERDTSDKQGSTKKQKTGVEE